MLLGSGNELEFLIYLRNRHSGHMILSLCLHNRMRQIEGHARPRHLGRVDAVAADAGRRVHKSSHLTAALEKLKADHQAHVSAAKHQNPFSGADAVKIHHGLGRACADDARQGPALKGHHVF